MAKLSLQSTFYIRIIISVENIHAASYLFHNYLMKYKRTLLFKREIVENILQPFLKQHYKCLHRVLAK